MAQDWRYRATLGAICGGLAGCAPATPDAQSPDYRGSEAIWLADDLLSVRAWMRGAQHAGDVARYGDCALARYAQAQGFGYARPLRSVVDVEAGLWQSDAVYTISRSEPRGSRVIDTVETLQACAADGIPAA